MKPNDKAFVALLVFGQRKVAPIPHITIPRLDKTKRDMKPYGSMKHVINVGIEKCDVGNRKVVNHYCMVGGYPKNHRLLSFGKR